MKLFLSDKLNKLAITVTSTALVNSMLLAPVQAQEAEPAKSPQEQKQTTQIIKMKLDSASRNEWIRVEVSGDTVKALHTTITESGLSRTIHMIPIPIPLPQFYGWHDHQTTHLAFQPDSCSENTVPVLSQPSSSTPDQPNTSSSQPSSTTPNQPNTPSSQPSTTTPNQSSTSLSCAIEGTDSIVVPQGMDIRQGQFKIDYTEGKLLRSITFKLPSDTKLASDKGVK